MKLSELVPIPHNPNKAPPKPKLKNGKSNDPKRAGRQGFYVYEQYSADGKLLREWKSLTEVEKVIGLSPQSVARACKGRSPGYTGFHWKKTPRTEYIPKDNWVTLPTHNQYEITQQGDIRTKETARQPGGFNSENATRSKRIKAGPKLKFIKGYAKIRHPINNMQKNLTREDVVEIWLYVTKSSWIDCEKPL